MTHGATSQRNLLKVQFNQAKKKKFAKWTKSRSLKTKDMTFLLPPHSNPKIDWGLGFITTCVDPIVKFHFKDHRRE